MEAQATSEHQPITRQKMIAGTAAMAAANVVRLCAQVAILPIIARLLGPESYGIVALATPFVFFLLMFGDAGLAASLVRAKTASRELESTIFWVAVSIGVTLALLLAAVAYPLGHLLGQPEVSPILLGFCPVFVLATLGVVQSARLQRTGRFGIFAISDLISAFTGMGVAVYGAMNGWGAWSLVAQQLTVWTCKVCVVTSAARFVPLLVFHFHQIRSALKFGGGLLGSQIADFFGSSLDNVLIGTFLGPAPLGFYALGYQIINLPSMVLGAAHHSVFPAVAEAHRNDRTVENIYLETFRIMLLIAVPVIAGLAITADMAVGIILGETWMPIVPIIQLLAPAGVFQAIFILNSALLLGVGRSGIEFWSTIMRTGFVVAGILAGLHFGSRGVAAGVTAGVALSGVLYMRVAMRAGGISLSRLLHTASAPLTAGLVLALGVMAVRYVTFDSLPRSAAFTVCVVSGCLIYFSVLFFGFREKLADDVRVVRSILAKKG